MRINHTEVQTTFKITAIKFKVTYNIVTQINWKLIGNHKTNNELFNNSLYVYVDGSTTYS